MGEDENGSMIKAFERLTSDISDIEMGHFGTFVCNLHGFKGKTQSVHEARLMKLHQQAGRFDCKKKNLKSVDCSLLPPCRKKTLIMKVRRAQYVSSIWSNSDLARPTQHFDKTKYG